MSVGLVAASMTGGNNGATMKALVELEQFAASFNQEGLEANLLEHARAQGRLSISQLAAQTAEAPGVPDLSASAEAWVDPYANVSLTTLGGIARHRVQTDVKVGVASADGLVTGLAFFLARKGGSEPAQVASIRLASGAATAEDLETLQQTERARRELAEVRRRHTLAEKKYERLEKLLESRRKWKAHWKVIKKTNEKRIEALRDLKQRKVELDAALDKYQALAATAEAFKHTKGTADPRLSVAKVTVSQAGKQLDFAFPVTIEEHEAKLPALTGVEFSRTRRAGLWNAVRELSPEEAAAEAGRHFGWHYAHMEAGPIKLGGMTVLHLWPLALPVLLLLLRKRVARVSTSYDPYSAADFDLPRVGAGHVALDAIVLAALPTVACALVIFDLWDIGELPFTAALGTMGSAILGPWATLELRELRGLKDAVRYSHSNPPPAVL